MKGLNLKEIAEINNILNTYLAENDFELTAELGTDFAYYYDESKITYALAMSDRSARLFKNFCKTLEPDVDADIFILSIFHEIFHNETICDIDDDIYSHDQAMKKDIETLMQDCSESEAEVLSNKYFALDTEILATLGGLQYIKNHEAEVKALWSQLLPHIQKFYKDNNVE